MLKEESYFMTCPHYHEKALLSVLFSGFKGPRDVGVPYRYVGCRCSLRDDKGLGCPFIDCPVCSHEPL